MSMVMFNGRDYKLYDITKCVHCGEEIIANEIVDDFDYDHDEDDHTYDEIYYFKTPRFVHSDPKTPCKEGCGPSPDYYADIIRNGKYLKVICPDTGKELGDTEQCLWGYCNQCKRKPSKTIRVWTEEDEVEYQKELERLKKHLDDSDFCDIEQEDTQ